MGVHEARIKDNRILLPKPLRNYLGLAPGMTLYPVLISDGHLDLYTEDQFRRLSNETGTGAGNDHDTFYEDYLIANHHTTSRDSGGDDTEAAYKLLHALSSRVVIDSEGGVRLPTRAMSGFNGYGLIVFEDNKFGIWDTNRYYRNKLGLDGTSS